jgi:predicted AlkP superfamily phosphohydrolase/phosphomutase
MLKGRKPNKHILKPLNMPISKELVDAPICIDLVECEKQNTGESNEFNENFEPRNDASHRYNNNKRLHDSYVKDISESQQMSLDVSPIKEAPSSLMGKDYD